MTNNTTAKLAKDLYKINEFTNKDKEQIVILITDFFAAMCAGYRLNSEFNEKLRTIIASDGNEQSSYVFGQKEKLSCDKAAFLNSVYGHGAELDDGNKKAAGHAGVHIIPSVFALADKLNSSNKDVLRAIATGYEAYIRISSSVQPGIVERGFHSTGMAGTLACAAACARLYHLDSNGIENAIALATTLSGGLLSYGDSRPAIKPLNPGKAAANGIFAASLASVGVQGPEAALEGPHGWFHAVSDHVNLRMLQGKDHLLLHECYMKLYPSCRHTHCGIDAGIYLHGKVSIAEINRIEVFIYPKAIELAGLEMPVDKDETKFSIKYTLACALKDGKYGMDSMDPPKLTADIINIMEKISLIPDPMLEKKEEGIRGTTVVVHLKNGDNVQAMVLIPRGDPENPLTRDEVINKLKTCATYCDRDGAVLTVREDIERILTKGTFVNPIRRVS